MRVGHVVERHGESPTLSGQLEPIGMRLEPPGLGAPRGTPQNGILTRGAFLDVRVGVHLPTVDPSRRVNLGFRPQNPCGFLLIAA